MARDPTGSRQRELARRRALAFSRRAAEMRRAADAADLSNRRRVLLDAEAQYRALARRQLLIARRA